MYLIGYTKEFRDLGMVVQKLLVEKLKGKEKVVLVEIKPELDGGKRDIFEVTHYDDEGIAYIYSEKEITQMIKNLLATHLYKLVYETLKVQLPN